MTRLFITLTVPEVQTAFRGYILFPQGTMQSTVTYFVFADGTVQGHCAQK